MGNELVIKGSGESEVKLSREEVQAELGISDNAVLVKLEIGASFNCVFEQIEHIAKAPSPMLHGKMLDANMSPFKMWADGWLQNAFTRMPALFGKPVRLKRLGDREYANGVGKSYAIIDLKRLEELAKKDQPVAG